MYWVTGILGFLLMAAPYFFQYSNNPTALWASLLFGGGVVAVAFIEGFAKGRGRWEYWVAALAGVAIILAPFVFGFGTVAAALWTSISIGILLTVIAGSQLFYDQKSFE
jgi:hypothetical protein